MSIIETIKGLFGSKAAEMANSLSGATANATSGMTEKVTNMATDAANNLINFDDINLSKFTEMVNKFGLMDKLPESIKAKLTDGTLSDEDVKSFIPEIKDIIMSKISAINAAKEEAHVCEENCSH